MTKRLALALSILVALAAPALAGTAANNPPRAGGGGGGGVTSVSAGSGCITVSASTGAVVFDNGCPFGPDTIIKLPNSASTPVSAWEGTATLTTNTAGSEVSKYVVKLLNAGVQVTALDIRPGQLLVTNGTTSAPGLAFQSAPAVGMWYDPVAVRVYMGRAAVAASVYIDADGSTVVGGSILYVGVAKDTYVWRNGSGYLYLDSTNGIVMGNHNLAFFAGTPVARQTVGANVNNVAASGTTGQFDDFTSLTVYATDAAAIHADIAQLARTVTQLTVAVRNYNLGN